MITQRKTVTPQNSDKNAITNFFIDTPNLRSLDNNACRHLIRLHLQARQLEGGWFAAKHHCARPHLHVALEHKASLPPKNIGRERYDK